eukprot:1394794-Pyramimonas_sp.AAC.1
MGDPSRAKGVLYFNVCTVTPAQSTASCAAPPGSQANVVTSHGGPHKTHHARPRSRMRAPRAAPIDSHVMAPILTWRYNGPRPKANFSFPASRSPCRLWAIQ